MSYERDYYEDRKKSWRRWAFWRGFGVAIVILVALVALIASFGDSRPSGPHVARYSITGIIFDDHARDLLFSELAENDDVKAVIIRIDSPGGTTAGSEALFNSIRKISAQKPVVAVLGEVAASGGYIAAIAADKSFALGNTMTGSIGVIMEYPNVTGLMETLGIEMQTVRSSDVKGGASPFRETTQAERAEEIAMVEESYQWFRGLVAERRGLDETALDVVAQGGVYSGRQAVENGLVDALGNEDDAIAYLESLDPAFTELTVESWLPETSPVGLIGLLGAKLGINPLLSGISPPSGPRLYSIKR